jgi:NAD-dependent deacetylase
MTSLPFDETLLHRAAADIARARRTVALTGAGISVESGIPPFRGKGGLWEKIDPMKYAHIDALVKDPESVWRVLIKDMKDLLDHARPNDAHKGLARLEEMGLLEAVITQNIDGLHQMAGSRDVIEFHGSFARQRCMNCGRRMATADVDLHELPPRCDCGGVLRPEAVFFGELIAPEHLLRSQQLAARCDVMLVIGTSAVVQPFADLPVIARQAGATVIEINPEKTPLTGETSDYLLAGKAGEVMRALVGIIEEEFGKARP